VNTTERHRSVVYVFRSMLFVIRRLRRRGVPIRY
jgi:hypothetical protein